MASENIFAFQVWKLFQQSFDRVTTGKIFENSLYRIPQSPNARLPMADFGIHGDTRK